MNVYAVPLVNPATTQLVGPALTQLAPPGVAVTVYPVMVCPAGGVGASQRTVALPRPGDAFTLRGAANVDGPGTTGADAAENSPQPAVLRARTFTVYTVAFSSPVIVHERPGASTSHVRPPGAATAS